MRQLAQTTGRTGDRLQFRRIFQQFGDALEQTPRAAAVETSVIETEREFGLRNGNEFLLCIVPVRGFFPRAHAEEQGLIGQGNRGAPIQAERAEIRYRSDAATR